MVEIRTTNIEEALTTLRAGNCIGLDAHNAGWGDAELLCIIEALGEGYGVNLVKLDLSGNSFSKGALTALIATIGPRAAPVMAAAAAAR